MANSPQSKKRARQAEKRRQRNASSRSEVRTFIKRVLKAVKNGEHELAMREFQQASSKLDKAAQKGLIHKNKAARHKSRLNSKIKELVKAA